MYVFQKRLSKNQNFSATACKRFTMETEAPESLTPGLFIRQCSLWLRPADYCYLYQNDIINLFWFKWDLGGFKSKLLTSNLSQVQKGVIDSHKPGHHFLHPLNSGGRGKEWLLLQSEPPEGNHRNCTVFTQRKTYFKTAARQNISVPLLGVLEIRKPLGLSNPAFKEGYRELLKLCK